MSPASSNPAESNLESGTRLAFTGIILNALLAIIKVTAGVIGNSYALIADGIESMLDIGGSFVIWGGLKLAAKPPDATHPYGHGKAEPVAAIVVALGVIGAAFLLMIESIREILTPQHTPAPFTLAVLVLVVVVKEILFRRVTRLAVEAESSAIHADAWHHRSDAITSLTAFIGISIALWGGKGYESADDWAALFACGLIAFNGYRMFMPALREVMDTAPSPKMITDVKQIAANVKGVDDVEKCRIRKMGLEYYVDIHIGVNAEITVRKGHEIAHMVKDAIRNSNSAIADVLVHIEPVETQPV